MRVCLCVFMYLLKSEEGIGCPGTGVRDSCGSPCECWEPSLGPLQKQGVVLKAKSPKICVLQPC